MNNTFYLPRFLRLLNKHTKEHYKTYLMSVAVLAGLLAATLGYSVYMGWLKGGESKLAIFYLFLLLAGTIFTSMIFSDLGDKKKAISTLMLPVSHLERFLVGWIYSFVIFQLAFFTCFYAVDFVIMTLCKYAHPNYRLLNLFNEDSKTLWIFLFFWFLHSVALMGSVFFNKLHFIKTAFVFFMLILLSILFNNIEIRYLFGAGFRGTIPFTGMIMSEDGQEFLSSGRYAYVWNICLMVATFCIWTAAFFRMKEKQV